MSTKTHYIGGIVVLYFLCAVFPQFLFAQETHIVKITKDGFEPKVIEVGKGAAVIFENDDTELHWVATDPDPAHNGYPGSDIKYCGTQRQNRIFDTCHGIGHGATFRIRFSSPGEWGYHDHLNPSLVGTIIVTGVTASSTVEIVQSSNLSNEKKIEAWILRRWYGFFPQSRARKLSELHMLGISKSDAELEYWMRIFGYNDLLNKLVQDSTDPTQFADDEKSQALIGECHMEGHYLGRMAYKLTGISVVNESFIDPRCKFGFYHGVIEASLGTVGDENMVKKAAEACAAKEDMLQAILCAHVVGHGLMIYNNYDLPNVLKDCSIFEKGVLRTICYEGVFMENVFVVLGFGITYRETAWLDQKRPDFPCTSDALPKDPEVIEMCYFTQSLAWNPAGGMDKKLSIAGCARAPSSLRTMCYYGIGFNAAMPLVAMPDEKVAAFCAGMPTASDRQHCLIGALFMRTVFWGASASFQGFKNPALCSALGYKDVDACNAYERKNLTWLLGP